MPRRPVKDELWDRVAELFDRAIARPSAERDRWLEEACQGDEELRREVGALLDHHAGKGPLDRPVDAWAAADDPPDAVDLQAGSRLGRFEVRGPLGAGSMGEVYLAWDPALERQVALKLLPERLTEDAGRIERFRREALAISRLNHPNILTVHEIAEVDGRRVMVSELVEGETLRERLRRAPLAPGDAVDVAVQLARGLAAAHGVGIVHRDVKPENVMIRSDGLVKVLDFGLATSVGVVSGGSQRATEAGTILGTAAYMSPEQARGEPATPQSDIWALGCVLFEAIAGRRPFDGATAGDVLAAVLTTEPDWTLLPPETTPGVRAVLRRCLRKRPEQRLHDANDARIELEDAVDESPRPSAKRRRLGAGSAWTVAACALLGLVVVFVLRPPPSPPASPVSFELPPPQNQRFFLSVESSTLALSPDGGTLAFVGLEAQGPPTSIWIRPLGELAPRRLAGTEGAVSVFWSPDGRNLGFVADGRLKRVGLGGQAPVVLCRVEEGSGVSGTWGRGSILFASIQGDAIYRVPENGGQEPTIAVRADPGRRETRVAWPWFLSDGDRFLYLALSPDGGSRLRLADRSGHSREVGPMASRVELVDPDVVVFAREGALIAQRLDLEHAVLFGEPVALAPAVRTFGSTGGAAFAASRRGTVAVAATFDLQQLAIVDAEGRTERTLGSAMTANDVSVSHDGQRAIADRLRPGVATYDLWTFELRRGVETRLTEAPGTEVYAVWLPGDREIVYSGTSRNVPNIRRRDLATGEERDVLPPGGFQIAVAVTPDGRLLFRQRTPEGFVLLQAPLDGGAAPSPVLRPEALVWDAVLSPDGRILAYVSPEAGRPELFVRRLAGGESVRVSEAGAWRGRFAPDGGTLFWTTPDRHVVSATVSARDTLRVGTPEVRFATPPAGWTDFEILPDGRFLALVRETDGTLAPLTVITGWNAPRPRAEEP